MENPRPQPPGTTPLLPWLPPRTTAHRPHPRPPLTSGDDDDVEYEVSDESRAGGQRARGAGARSCSGGARAATNHASLACAQASELAGNRVLWAPMVSACVGRVHNPCIHQLFPPHNPSVRFLSHSSDSIADQHTVKFGTEYYLILVSKCTTYNFC